MADKEDRINAVLEKSGFFTNLENSPDFHEWQEKVVAKRLLTYLSNALLANLETPVGQADALNAIRNYQQLTFVAKDVFRVWKLTEKQMLSHLEKLNDSSDKPA